MHMWAQLFLNRIDLHKGKHLFGLASKAVPKFGEKRSLNRWCHWCLRVFEDLIEDFLHSDNLTYLTHVLKVYFFLLLLIAGESRLRRLVRAAWGPGGSLASVALYLIVVSTLPVALWVKDQRRAFRKLQQKGGCGSFPLHSQHLH